MTSDAQGGKAPARRSRQTASRSVLHRTFVRGDGVGTTPETTPIRGPVDVICAGMYRACSTWQYEVVAHLLEHHRGGRRLGYLMPEEYARAQQSPGTAEGEPTAIPGECWRVFKSHDGHPCFARAIAQRRAIAIYAYRDVRDVVFSLMHKRRLTFEPLLRQGMIHQVLANDRFWTRQPDVLIQSYDAIVADPVGAVRELARHLGIEPAEGEAERIADEYSLAANKARTEALQRQLEQTGMDLSEEANSLICDPATLLHWNHMRDGRSGSWFVESTPRQKVILQRMCGRWLTSRGYPLVPESASHDSMAVPRLSIGEGIRIEVEILRGWFSFQLREVSQRFPRLAATARRALGIKSPTEVGARVWSERQGG
jgi:hypothetical protein